MVVVGGVIVEVGTIGQNGDVVESIGHGVAVEDEVDKVFGVVKVEVGIGGVIERNVGSDPEEVDIVEVDGEVMNEYPEDVG